MILLGIGLGLGLGYRFTTYQDARRVRLVDGLETNILRVSPVKGWDQI